MPITVYKPLNLFLSFSKAKIFQKSNFKLNIQSHGLVGSAPPYNASDDLQVQVLACDSLPISFPSQCGIHPFHVKQIFCTIKIKTNFTNHGSEIPTDVLQMSVLVPRSRVCGILRIVQLKTK